MKIPSATKPLALTEKLFHLFKERNDVVIQKHSLVYKKGEYDFLKVSSKDIAPNDPVLLIRAGIHGDEISGPITIERHGNEIFDYAHKRGVKVILYPLDNPSGFVKERRYNIDNDAGWDPHRKGKNKRTGNNAFLHYELEDGSIKDDIRDGNIKFRRFMWSSDPSLGIHLPIETQLMHKLLKEDPLSQVKASLDLHQDFITPNAPPAAYQYVLGNIEAYKPITQEVSKICQLYKNQLMESGYEVETNENGVVIGNPIKSGAMEISDEDGSIVRYDGSLTDLFYRLGTPYNVAVETTGATPLNTACQVNLIWIQGLIDLIQKNSINDKRQEA